MTSMPRDHGVTLSQARYYIEKLRREVNEWPYPKDDRYKRKQIDLITAEQLYSQVQSMEKAA